jgi:Rrf2 family protein
MLKLSKRVEYGLMALQYLAKSGSVATTREISAAGNIPYELLAKVMQSLKHDGIIDSYQGVRGGYALLFSPESINLSRVVKALNEHTAITECISHSGAHETCEMLDSCTIKEPISRLQLRMEESVVSMTIAELL